MRVPGSSAKLAAVTKSTKYQIESGNKAPARTGGRQLPLQTITQTTLLLLLVLLASCNVVSSDALTRTPAPTQATAPAPEKATTALSSAPANSAGNNDPGPLRPPATFTPAPIIIVSPAFTPVHPNIDAPALATPTLIAESYSGLFIADLTNRDYGGGQLEIIETVETNESFTRYLITYPSDGLTIHGFMNVPNEGSRFPVAIVLHGYIDPDQYQTLDYTTRYADHLAEAGYFVLHPNMRGFPPSDDGPDAFRVGLAVDVLNLIAIIREQSKDPTGYLRRADTGDINLWGHSMGGGVALRVITVDNSPYIRSAVLYGAMSGDEARNFEKIRQWSGGEAGDFELATPLAIQKAISPIYHLDRVSAPISIHHGVIDDVVPPEWSDDLCQRLLQLQHPVECHSYAGMPHTFRGANDQLFMSRAAAFFDRY